MLNGHTDQIYLPICTKIQQITAPTSHTITKYVAETKLCPSNATDATYFMCRYETNMSIYLPHMSSVQSKVRLEGLLYMHVPLPGHSTLLHIQNKRKQETATVIYHAITTCFNRKYAPQMPYICHLYQFFHMHICRNLCQYIYPIHICPTTLYFIVSIFTQHCCTSV